MIEGFARPAALALGALVIPILLLYMLRPRRPRVVISSTFLWRKSEENVASTKPWQRLKPSVLLLLQLLALLALVVAIADPFARARGVSGKHLVLIVDASGSMLARDQDRTRLDVAVAQAREFISSFNSEGLISVVEASAVPRISISSSRDRAAVHAALNRIRAGEGSANFAEAFILAESLETSEFPASIVLLSDGGLSIEQRSLIPPGTIFQVVGSQERGDLALSIHVGETAGGFQALVEVRNNSERQERAEVFLDLDGLPLFSAPLEIAPSGSAEKSFTLGNRTGRLTARFENRDLLEENNRAFAVLDRSLPSRILLVTRENLFLEALLTQLPGAIVDVKSEPSDGRGYDLVVYDGVDAPGEVKAPALYVAPSKPPKGVKVLGDVATPNISFLAVNDPLLENVDLSDIAIARTAVVSIEGGHTLIGSNETPLLATWNDGTLRRVWIGFDLHESNLPLQVAFPVLGDNLLGWLTGARRSNGYAGDPIEIPPLPGAPSARVETPGGKRIEVVPGESFLDTNRSGFYEIVYTNAGQELSRQTTAVSFPPRENDLSARDLTTPRGGGGRGIIADARRPLWSLLAALVLLLLLFEWWWAHGRPMPVATTS